MLRDQSRPLWTCIQCSQKLAARRHLRQLQTVADSRTRQDDRYSHRPVTNPSTSDALLRDIFDKPSTWKNFASTPNPLTRRRPTGLFRNRFLTDPHGFERFVSHTLAKCRRIVANVLAYSTVDEYKRLVTDLDRLSDLLCRVIDVAEFVRSTHPDVAMQTAADTAYALMFDYMNVLNTTPGLNEQLKIALANPEVVKSWSEEERTVADILSKDFSQSAIHLPEEQRKAFVSISNDISVTGSHFLGSMASAQPTLQLDSTRLQGMDPMTVRQFSAWGKVTLPTTGSPANLALRTVDDPDTRREIYMANRTAKKSNIETLHHLLEQRAQLSKLAGFPSYAHMALSDKMAKTPQAVLGFLDALARNNAPIVKSQLSELLDLKKSDATKANFPERINAWDRDYYATRLTSSLRHSRPDSLSAFFSLGTVMQGLSRLFHRLYSLRLVPQTTLFGETWHPDVRRLDVMDDLRGHVGVIYCDLFQRAGKSPNPAHFTLRCSRRIAEEEIEEAAVTDSDAPQFDSPEEAANDGLATYRSKDNNQHLYQTPTIALICDFATQPGNQPALLSFSEVQTVFHEMGHALHSICGRTDMQNVSGTRCATDFAELPSVLMEHFASAPEVLALYARHWQTDAPLDPIRVQRRLEIDRRMLGAEVEAQILMSILDQVYHSDIHNGPAFDSTAVYHDTWNKYSCVPEPAGTSWQGFFGHLVGYGATYYAYLFDRVIAGKIWHDVFQRRPGGGVDPVAGEMFRDEVLRWGGARDGWKCVASVLGDTDGHLAEGKDKAMDTVGKWGLRS